MMIEFEAGHVVKLYTAIHAKLVEKSGHQNLESTAAALTQAVMVSSALSDSLGDIGPKISKAIADHE
jgi:hypothetical protein